MSGRPIRCATFRVVRDVVIRLGYEDNEFAILQKTVNNVLTALNVMLKTAGAWDVIEQVPCSIRLLPVTREDAAFRDFGAYERLLAAAASIDERSYLIVLLGGEGGSGSARSWRLSSQTSILSGAKSAFATRTGESS